MQLAVAHRVDLLKVFEGDADDLARDQLFAGASGLEEENEESDDGADASRVQSAVQRAQSVMGDNIDKLHERGEKLRNLDDKMSHLANEAEDFFANARKLRQQAEKNSKWLPF